MVNKTEREMIIRLRKQKKTVDDITALLGLKRSTVGFWVKRYDDTHSLENLHRSGRPTLLTKSKFALVKRKVHDFVRNQEESRCGVTSKQLKEIIEKEVGVKYTLRHVQRLLKQFGLSLITPRTMHILHDQNKVDVFREQFKKKCSSFLFTTHLHIRLFSIKYS